MLQALNTNNKELDDLFQTSQIIEDYFLSELILLDAHIFNITGRKFKSKSALSNKARQCVDLVYAENTVLDLVLNILTELGECMRSLLIGNYKSVFRSLRWTVEYTLFWIYMQSDRDETAKDRFNHYCEESMTKNEYKYLSRQVFDINTRVLEERLRFKEIHHKPSLEDMRDSISIYANAPKRIQDIPAQIRKLYHELSSMIHVSLNSIDQLRVTGKLPVFC